MGERMSTGLVEGGSSGREIMFQPGTKGMPSSADLTPGTSLSSAFGRVDERRWSGIRGMGGVPSLAPSMAAVKTASRGCWVASTAAAPASTSGVSAAEFAVELGSFEASCDKEGASGLEGRRSAGAALAVGLDRTVSRPSRTDLFGTPFSVAGAAARLSSVAGSIPAPKRSASAWRRSFSICFSEASSCRACSGAPITSMSRQRAWMRKRRSSNRSGLSDIILPFRRG